MTRLPGKVNLTPVDFDAWLRQLAGLLPRLHAISPEGHRWRHLPYNNLSTLQPPVWTKRPQAWAEAIRIGRGPRPAFEPRFIHRDFHPVNLLFEGEMLSGVVDWPNACVGPAGVDVAHCRWNLAAMYGLPAADRFRHGGGHEIVHESGSSHSSSGSSASSCRSAPVSSATRGISCRAQKRSSPSMMEIIAVGWRNVAVPT